MADGSVQTVTISAVDYEVYAYTSDPVADGDAYFGGRLGSGSWTGATSDQKAQGLVTARRWLDRLVWVGTKTDPAQETAFPRDSLTCRGEALDDALVPGAVVDGEFELALILLASPAAQDKASTGSNLKRGKAGSAEVEFFSPTFGVVGLDQALPTVAQQLVGCLLDSSIGGSSSAVFGNDGCSTFEDDYGLNAPLR